MPLLLLPRLWLPRLCVFRKGLGPRTSSSAHNNALVTGVALRLLARVGVVVRWVVTVDAKGMGKLGIFGEVCVETRDERRSLVVVVVAGVVATEGDARRMLCPCLRFCVVGVKTWRPRPLDAPVLGRGGKWFVVPNALVRPEDNEVRCWAINCSKATWCSGSSKIVGGEPGGEE